MLIIWWPYKWDFKSKIVLYPSLSHQDQVGVCVCRGWGVGVESGLDGWPQSLDRALVPVVIALLIPLTLTHVESFRALLFSKKQRSLLIEIPEVGFHSSPNS